MAQVGKAYFMKAGSSKETEFVTHRLSPVDRKLGQRAKVRICLTFVQHVPHDFVIPKSAH